MGWGISYISAAPVLLAPLQPMRLQDRGLRVSRNPMRPLRSHEGILAIRDEAKEDDRGLGGDSDPIGR